MTHCVTFPQKSNVKFSTAVIVIQIINVVNYNGKFGKLRKIAKKYSSTIQKCTFISSVDKIKRGKRKVDSYKRINYAHTRQRIDTVVREDAQKVPPLVVRPLRP